MLHVGVPDPLADHCTAPLALLVPHDGRKARRRFSLGAEDVAAQVMSNNAIRLDCFPNTAVCGDGVVEAGEHCDDGNTQACDGCSPTCRTEACGNGVIDCDEQCDAGIPIPPPASGCTARLHRGPAGAPHPGRRRPAARLRARMGASRSRTADRPRPAGRAEEPPGLRRRRSRAATSIRRPAAAASTSSQCLGGADARLGCAAASVGAVEVVRPKASDQSPARDRARPRARASSPSRWVRARSAPDASTSTCPQAGSRWRSRCRPSSSAASRIATP